MSKFTITLSHGEQVKHMNELSQSIVAELTIGGRIATNIREMLTDQDFSHIERSATEMAEVFGNSSDPIKRLRAKLDDYGKIKGNKRYTVKVLGSSWKVVVKAQKKVTASQAAKSTGDFIKKIGEMHTNAKTSKADRERAVLDLQLELGLITVAAHKKAA